MGLLHSLRGRIGRPPVRRSALRRSRCRLRLEVLEGRCLPSTVTTLNDAGTGSLRQAIVDTPSSGTVDFQDGLTGTITLTTGELLINKNLTVAGPGADVITVSGNHASRVFNVAATFSVTIAGLTVTDGQAPSFGNGSGIENAGTLTVTADAIRGNSAVGAFAGGIDNLGTLRVSDSTVTGNVGGAGAGIANRGGTATVERSVVSDNTSNFNGAGILNSMGGTLTVTGSTVRGNANIWGNGGGIDNDGILAVTESTVSGNSAEGGGGGILNGFGAFPDVRLTVSDSTFSNNTAASGGGGIANFAALTVTESTFTHNSAGFGGGIANYDGTLTLVGSTLSGNAANGGGIFRLGGQVSIRNTIIAGNTGQPAPDVSGVLISQGHNLIGDITGFSGFTTSDLIGIAGNPLDPLLAPLHDNGGPTLTMALLPGSPALAAGDATDAPAFDQRGPGFPRTRGGAVDIGAFEAPESPVTGGFGSFVLPPCDDCSSAAVPLGFTFDFLGRQFSQVWVNNNGNLTFDGPFADYAPAPLAGTGRAILAPFWADVYTGEPGTGRVTYGTGALNGDPAFGATWEAVAPFLPHGAANTFQVVIADHTARLGYFEVQFNYLSLGWDHPDSSDQPPRAGFSNGAGSSQELPGSGTFDALTDTGGNSLRVLRRYTLIVYPGQTGSPAPGEAFRVAPAAPPARGEPQAAVLTPPTVFRNPAVADNFFMWARAKQDAPFALGSLHPRRGQGVAPDFDPLPGDDMLAV